MATVETPGRNRTGSAVGLSATTATARQRGAGVAMMLASSAANQTGAAVGATAFPAIGPVGVVAVRQFVTALVLAPIVRPRFRGLGKDWWPILGLTAVFSVMNLSLYLAIDRIGLGLAVTLEFLGPLAVAIGSSRRAFDFACAGSAGVGVVVLTNPGPATDVVGVALALVAATAWACYILLNRTLGQRLPGIQGTAVASVVTAVAWTPIAVVWFFLRPPAGTALGLAAACGVLSSIVPYVVDLLALRRVPARVFGTFTSINPVWAAVAGWLLLEQALQLNEWIGITLIVVTNLAVSARGLARSPNPLGQRRPVPHHGSWSGRSPRRGRVGRLG
ncbi:inner membrane transporter RhtA [Amycolatopsis endophytica]|uniref:Inner membrane transporter RhtA n=1 Tax=Amycolatopsis endophytica TaxID=860233 RepID=A0A853BAF5_9PSEU|nr:inner membrane transporter RhtA [Amycolatopsis endophytica]